MEKKNGSLAKVGRRLKERRGSYRNMEEMLKRKRDERGGGEKRGWEEIFSRTKKTLSKNDEIVDQERRRGERQEGISGEGVERGTKRDV